MFSYGKKQKTSFATALAGWYGVGAILLAYALASMDVLSVHDANYILLNLSGALGIVADTLHDRDWQPMTLNVIWALVAAVALVRIFY